jgi:hypothetical protein
MRDKQGEARKLVATFSEPGTTIQFTQFSCTPFIIAPEMEHPIYFPAPAPRAGGGVASAVMEAARSAF